MMSNVYCNQCGHGPFEVDNKSNDPIVCWKCADPEIHIANYKTFAISMTDYEIGDSNFWIRDRYSL